MEGKKKRAEKNRNEVLLWKSEARQKHKHNKTSTHHDEPTQKFEIKLCCAAEIYARN